MKHHIIVALTLALAGCAQHGNRFEAAKVGELTPGVSTQSDAVSKLGKPSAVSNQANGSQLLQWQYVYGSAIGVGGGAHAAILFGPDGKMIRVTHLSTQ